jgi:hypothetical protein
LRRRQLRRSRNAGSRARSREDDTPEEKARSELRLAMMEKLFEYDPKVASGYYTRVWFVDFSILDH